MTTTLLFVAIFAVLSGCSNDKDTSVYDTTANPLGLPTQACELLDAIEAGQLIHYDVITDSFGRLYLENQELLENEHWKEIIRKLGSKFYNRANELIKRGVQSYSQAAGFYILASFSAPDNLQLAEKAALFTAWKKIMESADTKYTCSPVSRHLSERLDFIRYFVFGDSIQNKFAEQFLVHQLLDSMISTYSSKGFADQSPANQALLSYLKLSNSKPTNPVGQFTGPAVDLIAYRLVTFADGMSRFELYMVSQEAISTDYLIRLSSDTSIPNDDGQAELETVIREFAPFTPTSRWKPGETIVATTLLPHTTKLSQGQVMLIAASDSSLTSNSTPIDLSLVAEMPCTE